MDGWIGDESLAISFICRWSWDIKEIITFLETWYELWLSHLFGSYKIANWKEHSLKSIRDWLDSRRSWPYLPFWKCGWCVYAQKWYWFWRLLKKQSLSQHHSWKELRTQWTIQRRRRQKCIILFSSKEA
jgi:hypothetical protein